MPRPIKTTTSSHSTRPFEVSDAAAVGAGGAAAVTMNDSANDVASETLASSSSFGTSIGHQQQQFYAVPIATTLPQQSAAVGANGQYYYSANPYANVPITTMAEYQQAYYAQVQQQQQQMYQQQQQQPYAGSYGGTQHGSYHGSTAGSYRQ